MDERQHADDMSLNLSAIEGIDHLCDQFESAWRNGEAPSVENYLRDFPGPHRSHLLKELVALDIHYRRDSGESVYTEEYQTRFPAYAEAILSAFSQHTLSKSLLETDYQNPNSESSDQLINDRYRLLEKLGEGGMAIVYRVQDLQENRHVALKVMKTALSGTCKKRFAREFRAATGVDHVNCIKVYDFGESGGRPFFTMELFEGKHFNSLAGQELSVILTAIDQAACALDFVHRHRIIHRDVKPSNLLVLADWKTGTQPLVLQVRLTDFGLARFFGIPSSLSVESGFVGSLAYAAPEQIAAHRIDHRIDLYALGIVCYEVLTGHYPFEAARRAGMQTLMVCRST